MKLVAHVWALVRDEIPRNPADPRYRLFFRFDSASRTIVLAWINDGASLRTYGSRTDAYAVFRSMLERGNPPSDWKTLLSAASAARARAEATWQEGDGE